VEIKVLNESYNPVMKRKEMKVEVLHTSAGTPERYATRKALSEKLNAKLDNLYVLDMITGTGTQSTICQIELYEDPKSAIHIVPKHIVTRNLPAEERKKLKEGKEGAKKVAKPAPQKKPEKPEKKEEKPAGKPEEKPAEKKVEQKPAEKKAEQKPAEKKAEKKEEKKDTKKEESKPAKTK
jgi:ribosomal protein S24E